jgi:lipopolysaccharide transport system ATP-binding protein
VSEAVISLKNVSKCFERYAHPIDRLKDMLLPGKQRSERFWALQDIDLEVHRGETLGVIGQNGSGKSTLLQIIAGVLQPTSGKVTVRGRVSALLELGSGFNPEFTGRQNVFFNGRILGLTQSEIEARFDDIAAFADIADFIDQPVKSYSSGMFVRLAFAVAVHVDPDVLIVDEALAVGDGIFTHRCMAKIKDFQDLGGTILFVSHDQGAVGRLCSKAIWINSGLMVASGEPSEISRSYQAWTYDQINTYHKSTMGLGEAVTPKNGVPERSVGARSPENPFVNKPYRAFPEADRFGTGRAEIVGFEVLDSTNSHTRFVSSGEWVRVVVKVLAHGHIQTPLVGISLYDRLRVAITGINTYQHQHVLPSLSPGTVLDIEFSIKWPEIQGGSYVLEPAIADGTQDSHEMLDWLQLLFSIESSFNDLTFGILKIPDPKIFHRVKVHEPVDQFDQSTMELK